MHVFLIPDGNRRYGTKKHISKDEAHIKGADKIKDVIGWCKDNANINQLSVYVLSIDNINKRKSDEVKMLCKLCIRELLELSKLKNDVESVIVNIPTMLYGVKDKTELLYDKIQLTERRFKVHNARLRADKTKLKLTLNLMIGYSAEEELKRAIWYMKDTISYKNLIANFKKELLIEDNVDLMIRTGGNHRISNGMLFQIIYAEMYFTDTLLPEFTQNEFNEIITWYNTINRRFGR